MRLAIVQSCYIPWKGFFDLIGQCDEYVVYDSAQYVKGHWHNRNRIKTSNGLKWLTIPVVTSGRFGQPIDEVEVKSPWADKHWQMLASAYKDAACFKELEPNVRSWYELAERERLLTKINLIFLSEISKLLGLQTRFSRDREYPMHGTKTTRIVGMAQTAKATEYLTGPSARAYLDESMFESAGIDVKWMSYEGYPAYNQIHPHFEHAVTVLDLLFNMGSRSRDYLLISREQRNPAEDAVRSSSGA